MLKRVLLAFSWNYPDIGYVQGMNFIAASLLFHANEVVTFGCMGLLLNQFAMWEVYQQGMNGYEKHLQGFLAVLGEWD